MSTITIKNLSPSVHQALKSRARVHGRSLNREIIATIEASLHSSRMDASAIGEHAKAVRETLGVYLTQSDLTMMKGERRK